MKITNGNFAKAEITEMIVENFDQEVDSYSLDELILYFRSILQSNSQYRYIQIKTNYDYYDYYEDENCYERSCVVGLNLIGHRSETDEEFDARISPLVEKLEKERIEKEIQEKAKREEEYKKYLELKERFG